MHPHPPHIESRSRQELHTNLRNSLVKKPFLLSYMLTNSKLKSKLIYKAYSLDFIKLGPMPVRNTSASRTFFQERHTRAIIWREGCQAE